MDIERSLISKIAYSGKGLEQALSKGIDQGHFRDPDAGRVWRGITEHSMKYRQQPSVSVLRADFPGYDFPMVTDSLEYIIERFIEEIDRREAIKAIEDLAEQVNDPKRTQPMAELVLEQARRLGQGLPGTRIARLSDMPTRIAEYDEAVKKGNPYGIRMGIPSFDELTFGIQPHEYVTIQGFLGRGKSTLAQWIMLNAYQQGGLLMYCSLEMESRALLRKWDVMLTNVPYRDVKAGTLSADDRKKWLKVAEQVSKATASGKSDVIVMDDVRDCTVDKVYAEMVKHRPDMMCIDYIQLMSSSRTAGQSKWEKMMQISNNLKQVSRALGIPIVSVAQTGRDSADMAPELQHVGGSIAINQDSDIVLTLHSTPEMKENKRMLVKMLKNRDGRTADVDMSWDMERMMFEEMPAAMPFTKRGTP